MLVYLLFQPPSRTYHAIAVPVPSAGNHLLRESSVSAATALSPGFRGRGQVAAGPVHGVPSSCSVADCSRAGASAPSTLGFPTHTPRRLRPRRACTDKPGARVRTGAMPWARASAHVIRPFPLSSHRARASTSGSGEGDSAAVGVGLAIAVAEAPGASTIISVDSHSARTLSIASASARSMLSPYSRRTWTVRSTYQHRFNSGSHSAASLATFW